MFYHFGITSEGLLLSLAHFLDVAGMGGEGTGCRGEHAMQCTEFLRQRVHEQLTQDQPQVPNMS